ncbi:hypothetical protein BZA70DRAFT_153024 [Myxozyma melibiosi]|uniref:Mitotic-spindle organizing protein 1 n=1 Tax=Myxozyma melibiosi TaxID=54550 RepID=A0ABR1F670_9ASCO
MPDTNESYQPDGLGQASPATAESSAKPPLSDDDILDKLYEVALLLDAGIDKQTIATCIKLCDSGMSPEALAKMISGLKDEATSHPER